MQQETNLAWRLMRRFAFGLDAERSHELAMGVLQACSSFCPDSLPITHWSRDNGSLARNFFGVQFKNPLGLAAGFDKNAVCLPAWQSLGFGFVEVGSVTAVPQEGNERPRLFRLQKERGLLNRLGFNNHGAATVASRVEQCKAKGKIEIPIGINIGKSRTASLEDAPQDYLQSFMRVADAADYIVINVSSPNTPNLRDLQQEESLTRLLDVLQSANQKRKARKPILVKLSPDLSSDAALKCAEIALAHMVVGLVISNTTIDKSVAPASANLGNGGISGLPLFERSTEQLRFLNNAFANKLMFIGVGGILNTQMASQKMEAGADLIQSYTGFVYGGPSFPKHILRGLVSFQNAV